jgi:methionyl-tRNA synthetase
VLIKQADQQARVQAVCTMGLNLFRLLMIYLKPVLPQVAEQTEEFLRIPPLRWDDIHHPLLDHDIARFKPLMQRIETSRITAMVEASRENLAAVAAQPAGPLADTPIAPEITIDDFLKVDLRIARIARAEPVEGADKLVRLSLDLGGQTRQVFAGIKTAYRAQDLEGRLTVMVANLAPRKMRFGLSEGMVLAAGDGSGIYLLGADAGAEPGMRVK